MSSAEFAAVPASLVSRVKGILLQPKTEWPVIEAEATDTAKLFTGYIGILAAIPALASFIGMSLIGFTVPIVGTTIRVGLVRGLVSALVTYCLTLVGCYVSALIIDKLAPSFESKPDQIQALKLVAYASTPVWVGGIVQVIPALGMLGILFALYAIYLFYLGVPVQMKTPPAKVIPYMVVSAIVIIVVSVVIGVVTASLTGVGGYRM